MGQKGEQLISKLNKIVSNLLEDGVKSKIVYNSAKLSRYFNVKHFNPQKHKSNLVYECTCPQIGSTESYICETEEHIINHN